LTKKSKGKEQGGEEQRAKSKEQRAKSKGGEMQFGSFSFWPGGQVVEALESADKSAHSKFTRCRQICVPGRRALM